MSDYQYTISIKERGLSVVGKITRSLRKMSSAVDENRSGFSSMAKKMIALNQGAEMISRLTDQMQKIVQPGVLFQQSMADLSAITGITGKDLERLGDVARATGIKSGLGAVQATEAFKLLASQISVDKIGIKGLEELQRRTITLAQASGMSMQEAANALAGTINQFGMQADEASRVINVLAAGAKYGAAEIPQLSQSFKVVGSAASAAGLSVEQTAGALEVLSKANLKGAEAGTALRNVLLNMQTKMGVDFKITKMSDALKSLKPHLNDTTMLAKTFGIENIAAAQFLIKNADAVDAMTGKLSNTNTAQEQANIRMSTTSERLKRLQARFKDWGIAVFNATQKYLPLITFFSQGALMLANLSPLLMGLGKATKFAGKWGKKAGKWMGGFAKKTALAGWNALKAMGKFVMMAVTGLGSMIWSLAVATAAQLGLNTAMTANPIGVIIVAIGLLIAAIIAIVKNWDKVKAALAKFWEWMKGLWNKIWLFVKKYHPLSLIIRLADKLFPGFKSWIKKSIDTLLEYFTKLWSKIVNAFRKVKKALGFGDNTNVDVHVDTKAGKGKTALKKSPVNLNADNFNMDTSGGTELQKGISGITSAGARPTNINIKIGKFQDAINVYSQNLDEALDEIEEQISRRLISIINKGNQLQGI